MRSGASLPELTYRFPTPINGAQNPASAFIIFDWNTDMNTSQFSDDASRANNLILMEDATSTIIPTTYVSYTAQSRRVTIQPASGLNSGITYRVLLKNKLLSSDGRKSMNEYLWTFNTASGNVNQATPLSPGNFTVQPLAPIINWTPITFIGSAGSALSVNYTLQLSTRFDFGTIDYETNTTASSAYPMYPGFITDDTTYYWRVLPSTVEATGSWTDTWQFYYGVLLDSDPTNRQYLPEGDIFGIKKTGFVPMSSNLLNFPNNLTFTFTSPPASDYLSYTEVWGRSVLPRNDNVSTYQDFLVEGTWVATGCVLTFVPTLPINQNTRYEFRFSCDMLNTAGFELGEDYSIWFTSQYKPFYVSPRVIRARFLSAEQKIPDDLINFYIFQASLEANARYWGTSIISPSVGDYLIESLVRDSPNLLSFGVLKWTEAAASYKILKAILFESLRDIGRSEKIGDSEVSLTKDFMAGINTALEETNEELTQWENYLTPSHMPVTVPKSFGWNPRMWEHDWSIMGHEGSRGRGFGHESSNDFSRGYGEGFGRGY